MRISNFKKYYHSNKLLGNSKSRNSFPVLFSFVIIAIVGFIILDHYKIHNGDPFQVEDLIFAINSVFKSHEGIILIIAVISVSIIIGDHFYKKIK